MKKKKYLYLLWYLFCVVLIMASIPFTITDPEFWFICVGAGGLYAAGMMHQIYCGTDN